MRDRPEPTLVFSVDYHDGRDGKKGWPIVVWMWAAPTVGSIVEVGVWVKRDDGAVQVTKRCKVVDVVLYTYGPEVAREYAGEMMLAAMV